MTCYSIQCIQCVISVLFLFTQLVIVVPYSPHFNMRFYALPSRHAANVIKLPAKGLSLSRASLYSTSSADTLKFVDNDRFSVAPMMDYTDQHQRTLFRFISKRSVLYTEMVTCQALVHAQDKTKFLDCDFNHEEPLVLQLGGSDPKMCREAAAVAKAYGYKEINLNVGCPSDRVADAGCFGAALMAKPDLVADIMLSIDEVMLNSGSSSSGSTCRPSTVKCRIGIDECDSYEYLCNFIHRIHEKAKVNHFIIQARKAILGGKLSPEENRKIPPLKYNYVYRLIQDFPHLKFTINGGILSYEEIDKHFKEGRVHGVMVGRQVVNTPYYWRNIDSLIYHQADPGIRLFLFSTMSFSN